MDESPTLSVLTVQAAYLLIALLLLVDVSGASGITYVAPGDADAECLNEPTRIGVPRRQKTLLDTQDYKERALLENDGEAGIWNSENFDGKPNGTVPKWKDFAQTVSCKHLLIVCAPDFQPQDNWLITQYINITDDGVDELVINVTFTTSIPTDDCTNCQLSFAIQSFETDVVNETSRSDQSYYKNTGAIFFHQQSDLEESLENQFSVEKKGLYLAVVDRGSCTSINRIHVFYYVCPAQVVNMVVHPETVSPPSFNPQDRPATGTCIENASPVGSGVVSSIFELECNVYGNWEANEYSCSCSPGYEKIMESCKPCVETRYKLYQGNMECTQCPENSISRGPGAVSCDCIGGYYRAASENVTVECTAPPTAPLNIHSTSVGTQSVTISWSRPTDTGGRTDLSYSVMYSNGTYTSPVFSVNDTQYNITGLTPSTQYTISVISINGVSDQEPDTDTSRTASIIINTQSRDFSVRITSSILQWTEPNYFPGSFLYYAILTAPFNDSNMAKVRATTSNTTFDLSRVFISENNIDNTYYIWVQAIFSTGVSKMSVAVQYTVYDKSADGIDSGGSSTDLTYFITATIVLTTGLVLAFSVLVIVCLVLLYYKRNQMNGRRPQMNVAYGVITVSARPADYEVPSHLIATATNKPKRVDPVYEEMNEYL